MTDAPAENQDPVGRPRNWDIAVSCAYLRLLGATQEQAASRAGASPRSLRTWEQCSWWKDALAEARSRWFKDGDAAAMRGIHKALRSDGHYAKTSMWWAERRMPELKPPNVKVDAELTGPGGEPLNINVRFIKPSE